MEEEVEIKNLNPVIIEKRLWNLHNFFIALIIGLILIVFFFILFVVLETNLQWSIILASFIIIIYAIILFFLLEPGVLREVNKTTVRTIKKPVIKEVAKQFVIEKPIVERVEVEKPIYIEKPVQIVHETDKTIYITNPRKKLNIPKYDFIGSSETMTYHKKSCRLGKLIKQKYKVSNNNENYFLTNKYKPCKACIKKKFS